MQFVSVCVCLFAYVFVCMCFLHVCVCCVFTCVVFLHVLCLCFASKRSHPSSCSRIERMVAAREAATRVGGEADFEREASKSRSVVAWLVILITLMI